MERKKTHINNTFYEELHTQWITARNHPVALLRAENKKRNPWILDTIRKTRGTCCTVLDIGCGAGFLSNLLAKEGHQVTGIDLSENSLAIAKQENTSTCYLKACAKKLPFLDQSFDVVCAMDLLEHVTEPNLVIQEASRVLKPGGLFFFHTFNRNVLSFLVVIKGVEWFVQNCPKHMHVYSLFLKPQEMKHFLSTHFLSVQEMRGLTPHFYSKSFWKMLLSGYVEDDFSFLFTKNLLTGYLGWALKQGEVPS